MEDLIEARRRAEESVQGMPEGDLKTKAFEVILSHLLSGGSTRAGGAPERASRSRRRRQSGRSRESAAEREPIFATDRILALREEGFFQDGRGMREIKDELQAHGWMYKLNAISGPLMKLVRQRHLRRAAFSDGSKKVFKYFNP